MITVEQVSVTYEDVLALSDVGLAARPGQVVGLIEPNGSSKTTLLRTLYTALTPRAGMICIDGTPVRSLHPRDVALRMAVVVQEAASDVPITVAEMVLRGRSPHHSAFQRYSGEDHLDIRYQHDPTVCCPESAATPPGQRRPA